MVAVAVVAIVIWGAGWSRKQYRDAVVLYEERLGYHRMNASINRFTLEFKPEEFPTLRLPIHSPTDLDRFRRLSEYHEAMILKYERALRYAWLPIAPDPPEPK